MNTSWSTANSKTGQHLGLFKEIQTKSLIHHSLKKQREAVNITNFAWKTVRIRTWSASLKNKKLETTCCPNKCAKPNLPDLTLRNKLPHDINSPAALHRTKANILCRGWTLAREQKHAGSTYQIWAVKNTLHTVAREKIGILRPFHFETFCFTSDAASVQYSTLLQYLFKGTPRYLVGKASKRTPR